MSSHTLHLVEQVCDRVVILARGRLIAEGTVAAIQRGAQRSGPLEDVRERMRVRES